MNEKERLIFRVLDLLELIKTKKNQPIINQIRGYLFNFLKE